MPRTSCIDLTDYERVSESSLVGNITAHRLLVLLSIASTSIALALSVCQILGHATHYHIPEQQRRINRLLFMVPVYATSNMLAAIFYQHSVYYELVGNAYAAIGLASFFNLLYSYVTEGAADPKLYFRRLRPKQWQWPLSWPMIGRHGLHPFRTPRSGLTWFNICYCGVFQYNFVLLTTCIVGIIASVFHKYCPSTLNPRHAYVWILLINAVSALISGYCLTQFHLQVRKDVYKHRADVQYLCVDIVLYLSTFQRLFISILARSGAIRTSSKLQDVDIRVALPATCLCMEMAFVAILHLYAYPVRPYKVWRRPKALENHVVGNVRTYTGKGMAVVAIVEMLNVLDLIDGIYRAFKYLLFDVRRRHHEIGYMNNHLKNVSVTSGNGGGMRTTSRTENNADSVEKMGLDTVIPSKPEAVYNQR